MPSPQRRRDQRLQALSDVRRGLVLDAAREVFEETGLDGANMREIARRAGYTPGAIYSYFDSKEAIYGALLAESLERLNAAVAAAVAADASPAAELRARSRGWFDFYLQHPRDLDLGFYLVGGLAARGLTAELNRALNRRLHDALAPGERALAALGLGADAVGAEAAALFAHGVGLLLLRHTGRIKLFGQDAGLLFEAYLSALLARCSPPATAPRARRKTRC